jgi:hypothetical protein
MTNYTFDMRYVRPIYNAPQNRRKTPFTFLDFNKRGEGEKTSVL